MGQKVNPIGLRVGIIKSWSSRWFARKSYADFLHEDLEIRRYLRRELGHAGLARIEIERPAYQIRLYVHTPKPGIIIGKKGAEVERIKKALQEKTKRKVYIDIIEVRNAETDAQLIAEGIALQLLRRIAFRRAMKRAIQSALRFNVKGIRIECGGRLGGAEMARRIRYLEGQVPLHTLRADIDFGLAESMTSYGVIGVKVWVYKGEVDPKDWSRREETIAPPPRRSRRDDRRGRGPRRSRRE